MKFKFKFNIINSFRYLYILLILANIIGLYFLFTYNNENIYKTIFVDEEFLESQATRGTGEINVNKFNEVIDSIRNKGYR